MIRFILPQFNCKSRSVEDVLVRTDKITDLEIEGEIKWKGHINKTSDMLMVFRSIALISNLSSYTIVSSLLESFIVTTSNINRFIIQGAKQVSKLDDYDKFWDKATYCEPAANYKLPNTLTVTDLKVAAGKRYITMKPLYLRRNGHGRSILVTGESGAGKSQFIRALLGHVPGAKMNIGSPANYYHTCADMFQSIRETFCSSGVTIRNYFNDHTSDEDILRCIKYFFTEEEFKKANITLDNKLTGKLSGGERSRILLAVQCFNVEMNKRRIIALDEPGSDLDVNRAVAAIKHMLSYQKTKNCTVVLISHLPPKYLEDIDFSARLKVADCKITHC